MQVSLNCNTEILQIITSCDRGESYPVAIRQKAARLVLEIAFIVYLKQFKTLADVSGSLLSVRGTRTQELEKHYVRFTHSLPLQLLRRILGTDGARY